MAQRRSDRSSASGPRQKRHATAPREDEEQFAVPRTQFVMLFAALGLAFGLAVVFFNLHSWDREARELAHSSSFVLWVALLASQTTLWTLALPPLLRILRGHLQEAALPSRTVWSRSLWASARREVFPSLVGLLSFVVVLFFASKLVGQLPEFNPLHHTKVIVLTAIGLLTAAIAAMSIWLIRGELETLRTAGGGARELRTYLRLRAHLEWLLAYLGAVIGLAVLASAALRRFAQHYGAETGVRVDFPVESVVLYGLVLSLLVALVYLPTYATLHRTGTTLRDQIAPLPEPGDDTFEARVSKRSTLDDLLGLRVSATTSFRAGVAILSPLLAGLTSLLPKLGG